MQITLEYALEEVQQTAVEEENIVTPVEEIMVQLRELLAMGDLDALVARARDISREDKKYNVFVRRIEKMAEEFQLAELDGLLQKHERYDKGDGKK